MDSTVDTTTMAYHAKLKWPADGVESLGYLYFFAAFNREMALRPQVPAEVENFWGREWPKEAH